VLYRKLGNSGLSVSAISLANYQPQSEPIDEQATKAWVRRALDLGITTFDTATIYSSGLAEGVLGRALDGANRSSIELCTKVFHPTGPGPNERGLGRKHLMISIDRSLRELGTDYIDLYQAHRFDDSVPLEETMTAFADMVRAGKVLHVGISEWSAEQIRAAAPVARELRAPLVSNRPQYSLLWRVIEEDVVPACAETGIGLIVWSATAAGLLGDGIPPGENGPAGIELTPELFEAAAQARQLAADAGIRLSQLAIAWALRQKGISSVVLTPRTPEDVEDYVGGMNVQLDDRLIQSIEELLEPWTVRDPSRSGIKTVP
jgi:aryl-alcohol dehydrogenase-like predicted oxidoreductase